MEKKGHIINPVISLTAVLCYLLPFLDVTAFVKEAAGNAVPEIGSFLQGDIGRYVGGMIGGYLESAIDKIPDFSASGFDLLAGFQLLGRFSGLLKSLGVSGFTMTAARCLVLLPLLLMAVAGVVQLARRDILSFKLSVCLGGAASLFTAVFMGMLSQGMAGNLAPAVIAAAINWRLITSDNVTPPPCGQRKSREDEKRLYLAGIITSAAGLIILLYQFVAKFEDVGAAYKFFAIIFLFVHVANLVMNGLQLGRGSGFSSLILRTEIVGEAVCILALLIAAWMNYQWIGIGLLPFWLLATALCAVSMAVCGHEDWSSAEDRRDYGRQTMAEGLLTGLNGMYASAQIPVTMGMKLVIGTSPELCSLVLPAAMVSKMHCEIAFDPVQGRYLVTDYSSNGTFLQDGRRLRPNEPSSLAPGTVIYLADRGNSFRLG